MVNTLATKYLETHSQDDFALLLGALNETWRFMRKKDARELRRTEEEMQALYEDILLKLLESRNIENFEHMLNRSILNAKRSIIRKNKRRRDSGFFEKTETDFITSENDDFDEPYLNRFSDGVTAETIFFENQKERDKRQLISFLLADESEFVRSILDAFNHCESVTAVSKFLGVHHSKVTRALARLRKKYDGNRAIFESHFEYLTA
jgi:hypothetical protein